MGSRTRLVLASLAGIAWLFVLAAASMLTESVEALYAVFGLVAVVGSPVVAVLSDRWLAVRAARQAEVRKTAFATAVDAEVQRLMAPQS